jgi:hypothetical protein
MIIVPNGINKNTNFILKFVKYARQLTQKYKETKLGIQNNLKSLTTAKLDLIRMFTECQENISKITTSQNDVSGDGTRPFTPKT